MARHKKTRAARGARPARAAKARAKPAVREVEPEADDLLEAADTEMPDAVPVALLIFSSLFLLGATILNMVHLGSSYGVGPFR